MNCDNYYVDLVKKTLYQELEQLKADKNELINYNYEIFKSLLYQIQKLKEEIVDLGIINDKQMSESEVYKREIRKLRERKRHIKGCNDKMMEKAMTDKQETHDFIIQHYKIFQDKRINTYIENSGIRFKITHRDLKLYICFENIIDASIINPNKEILILNLLELDEDDLCLLRNSDLSDLKLVNIIDKGNYYIKSMADVCIGNRVLETVYF